MVLHNIAAYLSLRFEQLGAIENLEGIIVLHQEALGLRPQGHPDWSLSLNDLASCLGLRYFLLSATGDLQEAVP